MTWIDKRTHAIALLIGLGGGGWWGHWIGPWPVVGIAVVLLIVEHARVLWWRR